MAKARFNAKDVATNAQNVSDAVSLAEYCKVLGIGVPKDAATQSALLIAAKAHQEALKSAQSAPSAKPEAHDIKVSLYTGQDGGRYVGIASGKGWKYQNLSAKLLVGILARQGDLQRIVAESNPTAWTEAVKASGGDGSKVKLWVASEDRKSASPYVAPTE